MKPETTLFMLSSVDGKISTGASDQFDFDKDLPNIPAAAEGLSQYYDLEKQTDLVSLNTGRVMAKIGANGKHGKIEKIPVTFVIIDNKPHLEISGVDYLLARAKNLILVTINPQHPAYARESENLKIVFYSPEIDFIDLFKKLRQEFGVEKMTVQSGGTLNAHLLRLNLIDHISLVVAPLLIGGKDTASLVDGSSLQTTGQLSEISGLKLVECRPLNHSYIHLRYDILPAHPL